MRTKMLLRAAWGEWVRPGKSDNPGGDNHCYRFGFCVALILALLALPARAGLTTLHTFAPEDPSSLIQGSDGAFYGTTSSGGGDGTVFRLSADGMLTTLVSFNGSNGRAPSSLIQGADGAFYGTTYSGGSGGEGTVFRLSASGALSTLASFDGSNGRAPSSLIQGADGAFYGTTADSLGDPIVFRLSADGTLSTLASFDGREFFIVNSLVQGSDGAIYGTTDRVSYYEYSDPTIFRLSSDGTLSTLETPFRLGTGTPELQFLGADGSIYGIVHVAYDVDPRDGRTENFGASVFRLSPDGQMTWVLNYSDYDHNNDVDILSLIQGSDGALYGINKYSSSSHYGRSGSSLFRLSLDGRHTTLATFVDERITTSLIQGSDGVFYGASRNSAGGEGAVFRLDPTPAPTLLSASPGDSLVQLTWTAVPGATGYAVYTNTLFSSVTGSTMYSVTGLTNGAPYTFDVRAIDGVEGLPSNELSATPVGPLVLVSPTYIDFRSVFIGQSSTGGVSVKNTGNGDLHVGTPTISGSTQFSITGNTCTAAVAPGASCTIIVQFTPTKAISHNALAIPSNAPGSPHTVKLTGQGKVAVPEASVTPTKINFGSILVGHSSPTKNVTVKNVGSGDLHVGTPTINGSSDLAIVGNTCTTPVAPGAACGIRVRFTPSQAVARSGGLVIPSDAPSSPNKVGLSGEGIAIATQLEVIPTFAVKLDPLALDLHLLPAPEAQLRELDSGAPVVGRTVSFRTKYGSLLNPDTPLDLCTAQTDSQGYATCPGLLSTVKATLHLIADLGQNVVANFAGDAIYLPSTDEGHMIMLGGN